MPFGFLKRRHAEGGARPAAGPGASASSAGAATGPAPNASAGLRAGPARGVPFIALTEDWRLRGRMQISGRLSDALNKREAIPIVDVSWGPPEAGSALEPAPGLRSVDPYDLILVTGGEDSLPPLTDAERAALKVHKVAYDLALEVPPFRVIGTVYLHPGTEPERLLERATDMFVPVIDAVARIGDSEASDPESEVILVNRFYLRGVEQVDKRTGEAHLRMPGSSLGGTD